MGRKGVNRAHNFARIMYRVMQAGRRGYPIARLLEECDISRSTYRDYRAVFRDEGALDFLAADGLLLEEFEGPDGGLRLRLVPEDAEELRATSPGWRERFVAAHLASRTLSILEGTELSRQVEHILEEVESAIRDPELRRRMREDIPRKLYVHPTGQPTYASQGEVLEEVIRALLHQRALTITYDSASHDRPPFDMVVHPYTLAFARDAFYLIASHVDHDDVRTFAMTRVVAARRDSSHRFSYPTDYDPARLFDGHFGARMSSDTAPRHEVVLRFAPSHSLHIYLKERTWHPTQQFEELPDGRLEMRFVVRALHGLRPWVRSFGREVEVVAPPGFVEGGEAIC